MGVERDLQAPGDVPLEMLMRVEDYETAEMRLAGRFTEPPTPNEEEDDDA